MNSKPAFDPERDTIASIVRFNGGRLAGKTRLQKTVFLLQALNLLDEFDFNYHYYGPYSAEVAAAADRAVEADILKGDQLRSNFGIYYTDYVSVRDVDYPFENEDRVISVLQTMDQYDSITLEVAATWIYLEKEEGNSKEEALTLLEVLKDGKASKERVFGADALLRSLGLH